MNVLKTIAAVLLIIGGLNWGLVALGYNAVEMLLGMGTLTQVVYGLVGVSALYSAYAWCCCGTCCK